MTRFKTLHGLLGIALLLAGVIFIYLGYTSKTIVDEFKIYWMFTFSALILGLIICAHEKGIHLATYIARIFTGSLFIVSGLIKANDPKGFGYKLEEYFNEHSLGPFWENFYDYALPLAILIAAVEILLGLAVLVGGKARLTSWTLLAMALFFAWLTHFTATCISDREAFMAMSSEKTLKIEEQFKPQYEKAKEGCGDYYDYKDEVIDSTYTPDDIAGITNCNKLVAEVDTLKKRELAKIGSFDKACVDDCGCFGDALKGSVGRSLTPWESFYKDIMLLFFVLVLVVQQGKIKLNNNRDDLVILTLSLLAISFFAGGLFGWMWPTYFTAIAVLLYWMVKQYYIKKIGNEWTIAIVFAAWCFGFTFYCKHYLPVKDFRPYAVGKDLIEERTDISPKQTFIYILKDKKTGVVDSLEAFPENYEANYEYMGFTTKVIEPGKDAPARDFSISVMGTGEEITDSVLNMQKVIFIVAYNIKTTNTEAMKKLVVLNEELKKAGHNVFCLTASPEEEVLEAEKEFGKGLNFYNGDEKTLKTMIRSNPGLMIFTREEITDEAELKKRQKLMEENRAVFPAHRLVSRAMWPGTALPDLDELNEHLK